MSGRKKSLSKEDRILWGQVARTVDAYPGRLESLLDEELEKGTQETKNPNRTTVRSRVDSEPPKQKTVRTNMSAQAINPIDRSVYRKIARGRLPLEARIDLHGMTQDEAHDLLLGFLRSAHARGLRHVLVITGKGTSRGGEGVLRRAVPKWLGFAAFRELASGVEPAARGHGGDGALYVRLKRKVVER
ncbi:Smr/MutS family protein [Hoeflea poritis]|uniref:Smr/MutS family protein n=1 Tax=Hoeflea poritis TaxID=2993659 RepID=A0ABT4VKX6_9HYPH|nr:Smr/MutS family protein [Hoeflea poritis]MDA4845339.1 Smr/MutS family protein [Hoeflea poritis]